MGRPHIPEPDLDALRAEVGYVCPVPGCNNPYLTWHHFDPTWGEGQLHDPAGMIAMCRVHADAADGKTWTNGQLREMKANARGRAGAPSGRFDWMRKDVLAVVGGQFHYRNSVAAVAVGIGGAVVPLVSLQRDDDGYLLLSLNMPTTSGEPRLHVEKNVWRETGDPVKFRCPPSGKRVEATYANGDWLRVEFREIESGEEFDARYKYGAGARQMLEEPDKGGFPVTTVDVRIRVVAPDGSRIIDFGSQVMRYGGSRHYGMITTGGAIGLMLG